MRRSYRRGPKARTREVELDAPGWAVVGYSRAQALAERAVLPVTFARSMARRAGGTKTERSLVPTASLWIGAQEGLCR
ncbi:MAG TPA: hypothetical protein VIL69_10275 [Roseomonas sp.]